ncbi:MAG TPA: biopolymer transporter ExbD [Polyangiaceae bacterium]|jgi:biopolymer transport protein ExbD|nr:biopolymer transporter ExbD [Polyangiaceae bacterium]
MATLDVGARRGAREVNHELPLVPFIDFLLCIVAFLLVTAVWSEMARLDASARAPGTLADVPTPPSAELHVDMRDARQFVLEWRQGSTVLAKEAVPRAEGVERTRYPELANRVRSLWERSGVHRAPGDREHDRAVLHTSNAAPFEEIVGAMDAIAGTRRNGSRDEPAFNVVFAVD